MHEPDSESSPTRRHVLVADDNRAAAESLAILLTMEGHTVTLAFDGQQALELLLSSTPEVALLDIGMPGLDGYEVARRVRQSDLGAAVALIALSGWGRETDVSRAFAAGFDHYLTKPVEPDRLSALLRSKELRRRDPAA
jgi:CheY-like chemotaxis protein